MVYTEVYTAPSEDEISYTQSHEHTASKSEAPFEGKTIGDGYSLKIERFVSSFKGTDELIVPSEKHPVRLGAIRKGYGSLFVRGQCENNCKPMLCRIYSKGVGIDQEIEAEIKALHELHSHDNVYHLYMVFEDVINWYLLGFDAFRDMLSFRDEMVLKNVRIDNEAVKKVVIGICNGLQHCHTKKIALCVFGLSSVFFDYMNNPLIANFRHSREIPSTKIKEILVPVSEYTGNRRLAPPEIFQDKDFSLQKADIWALGLLLYELLSRESSYDVCVAARNGTLVLPDILEELYPGSSEVILGLLNMDPLKRWTVDQTIESVWLYDSSAAGLESGATSRSTANSGTSLSSDPSLANGEQISMNREEIRYGTTTDVKNIDMEIVSWKYQDDNDEYCFRDMHKYWMKSGERDTKNKALSSIDTDEKSKPTLFGGCCHIGYSYESVGRIYCAPVEKGEKERWYKKCPEESLVTVN